MIAPPRLRQDVTDSTSLRVGPDPRVSGLEGESGVAIMWRQLTSSRVGASAVLAAQVGRSLVRAPRDHVDKVAEGR